ncbi:hypothetical protein HMPREF1870_00588 [Bacteroidales bacterium KA00344]|nr:hypothetical protein HMPREF1870_00588 [Bacteroidales bacterium KA00344]
MYISRISDKGNITLKYAKHLGVFVKINTNTQYFVASSGSKAQLY